MGTKERKAVQEDSDGSSGERERGVTGRKSRSYRGKEPGEAGDRIHVVSCRQTK